MDRSQTSPQPSLAAAYERARQLHREHGRTYYLATLLLPAWKRRHVHALYGFTRYADDVVDAPEPLPAGERARRLAELADAFRAALDPVPSQRAWAGAEQSDGTGGVLPAVLHTIDVFRLDRADFADFLDSMAMDLTVRGYPRYADLLGYMAGSAAAIGTMMLPILQAGESRPPADADAGVRESARELGRAFQLTNFLRDVAEDLARGRVYLPGEDLDRFGVSIDDLRAAAAARRAGQPVRELVAFEVQRARWHYARAAAGVPLLAPTSQPCIRAAYQIYGAILDEVERAGYDVFAGRVTVPNRRRVALAAAALKARPGSPVTVPGAPADPARTPRAAALAAALYPDQVMYRRRPAA